MVRVTETGYFEAELLIALLFGAGPAII